MARITVEDCLKVIPNKYELVELAAHRSKELIYGAKRQVKCKNKDLVVALREIAEGKLSVEYLRHSFISRFKANHNVESDDPYIEEADAFFMDNISEMPTGNMQTIDVSAEDSEIDDMIEEDVLDLSMDS